MSSCKKSQVNIGSFFVLKDSKENLKINREQIKQLEEDTIESIEPAQTNLENKDFSLFDYTNIKIELTEPIDINIRNCNIYLDIYNDILILGEIVNNSNNCKTNIQITFYFYDKFGNEIDSKVMNAFAEYLDNGAILPFCLVYDDKNKYIDLEKVKIGVNYSNFKQSLLGNPIAVVEKFYYEKKFKEEILVIDGVVENIGQNSVEDLKLFLTLYDFRDRVVLIRQGFLEKDKLGVFEKQDFEVKVMLDEYLKDFTHYNVGVFFRDSLKV